jgi:hypothetical protein
MLQVAGHFGPLGQPRVLRTARTTSGGYLATVIYTVTVHTRLMGHNGLHSGSMYWRGYNISVPLSIIIEHKAVSVCSMQDASPGEIW